MLRQDVANNEGTARIREDSQPNLSVVSILQLQYGVYMLSTKNSRGVENRLSNFICTIWESIVVPCNPFSPYASSFFHQLCDTHAPHEKS